MKKGVMFLTLVLLVLAVGCTRWADVPLPPIPRVVGVYTIDGMLLETREIQVPNKKEDSQRQIVLEVPAGVEIPKQLALGSSQPEERNLGDLPRLTWGQPTPTATAEPVITPVPPNPDVDRDGLVNIFDLTAVGGLYGQPDGGPADVNGNGTVDIFDLAAVGGAYGSGEEIIAPKPRLGGPLR